jgi:hypothetical protein
MPKVKVPKAVVEVAATEGKAMELPTTIEVATNIDDGHYDERVDNAAAVQLKGRGNDSMTQRCVRVRGLQPEDNVHDLRVGAK